MIILGLFPHTEAGNRHILMAIYYFTKCLEGHAVPSLSSTTTVTKLFKEFLCRFGAPKELHSSQGRNFSKVFQGLGFEKTCTTPLILRAMGWWFCKQSA